MDMNFKTIFLSGTNGLPGRYGGWDNLLVNLSKELSNSYKVYCHTSTYDGDKNINYYEGAYIDFIDLKANGSQSIFYDFVCMYRALKAGGLCIMLGCSGGLFVPFFRFLGLKIILNPDGEEWERGKWSLWTKLFLKISFYVASIFSNYVVADHPSIFSNLIKFRSKKNTFYIPYGGDNAKKVALDRSSNLIPETFFENPYMFSVCRIEPENNVHMCLELAAKTKYLLLFIGNWKKSKYGIELKNKYSQYKNIKLLDPIYDPIILGALRSNSSIYFHGHTVGGTNPSLVEAMSLGLNIIAHDNKFNRYTTNNLVNYFSNQITLEKAFLNADSKPSNMDKLKKVVSDRYLWSQIVKDYRKVVQIALG